MSNNLASCDLDDLRAEGLTPADDDVVRLYLLAARLTDGPETSAANAPRWAIAGGIVFWEPSVAAWQWFDFASRFCESADDENMALAFACAHSRIRGAFDALYAPEAARDRLNEWRKGVHATVGEVVRAVNYCCHVNDVRPEPTEISKRHEAERKADPLADFERDNYSSVESLITQAAAATGLTFDDLIMQTPSRLGAMIYAAYIQAGLQMSKSSAKAHADYLATLHAIRVRLLAERDRKDPSP